VKPPRIVRAANDVLFADDGATYIDLFTAHGTTFLGHAEPHLAARIGEQLQNVWLTGGLETPIAVQARTQIEAWFPASHGVAGLYSTGMEAAEFALRFARATTGRNGMLGFEQSMHGKSLATAYLGWDNAAAVRLPDFQRLPFLQRCQEAHVLQRLSDALAQQSVAAVFIEPIQGCGGGRAISRGFAQSAARLAHEHGALLVFDELLTGLRRTGPRFCFEELGVTPDVVLIGKALGNGFPVSAVIADRRHALRKQMFPGSTFAGNALACAAVSATLERMSQLDIAARVAAIERSVLERLSAVQEHGVALRGRGALWILEFREGFDVERLAHDIYAAGVCIGYAGRHLRLLPAATIEPANLERACEIVAEAVHRAHVTP
jgi:acetylornithine/succinyldiaminopimelate/putrescine aminotransferase